MATDQTQVNLDCSDDDLDFEAEAEKVSVSHRYSLVSKRMIDQFFTEVEGPDRDWQLEEYLALSVDEPGTSTTVTETRESQT